jgi:hypothetical protein
MTAKRRLVPEKEVRSMAELLRGMGFRLDGPVEIRADSVVFHPANESAGDAYEQWSRENKGRD